MLLLQVFFDILGRLILHILPSDRYFTFIFLLIHLHPGDSPQIISVHTKSQEKKHIDFIKTGDTVTIYCNATGESPLKYTWLFDSETLPNEDGPTLVISDAKDVDQGAYQCRVMNGFGQDTSDNLNIKVGEFYIGIRSQILMHYTESKLSLNSLALKW